MMPMKDFHAALRIAPDDLDTINGISAALLKEGPSHGAREACLPSDGSFNVMKSRATEWAIAAVKGRMPRFHF